MFIKGFIFSMLAVATIAQAQDAQIIKTGASGVGHLIRVSDAKPDGYFNCPVFAAYAQIDTGEMGAEYSNNWADEGGSMSVGFNAESVSFRDGNVVSCYYPIGRGGGQWAVRTRKFDEFKRCEQGPLAAQFQCFK